MPYVGRDPRRGNYLKLDDIQSSFNGSTKTFNLTSGGTAYYPDSTLSVLVSVGGTVLEPATDYGITNNQITFTNAPESSYNFFAIVQSTAVNIGVPGDGSVTGDKLSKPLWYDNYFKLDSNNDRVGIGIENPVRLLHLHESNGNEATIHFSTSPTGTTVSDGFRVGMNASEEALVWNNETGIIKFGTGNTERLRILGDGEVLIGRNAWGSNAHPNDINKLVVTGTSPADAYDSQCYLEGSETSGAVNTGGALAFGGHDGSSHRNWANIYGMKENATGGNTAAYMAFHTRPAGGGPTERLRITSDGHVIPGADNSYDLGSSSKRWRNLYTTDLKLSNEGSKNDVDGTWGNYTIQEGENDLFLINKRSGKKYKFNLTEVL